VDTSGQTEVSIKTLMVALGLRKEWLELTQSLDSPPSSEG